MGAKMKLDIDTLLQLIEERSERFCEYIQISEDDTPFLIFESWESLEGLIAHLNGFENLKGSQPYLREGETLHSLLLKAQDALDKDPDNFRLQRDKEIALSHFLYAQHLETRSEDKIDLDDFDVECGFSDEYSLCGHCQKVVRTSPDSYSWVAPTFLEDVGFVCDDCCNKGLYDDEILEAYQNANKALPDSIDLDRAGLVKVNKDSFENGWYGGQNDTPEPIIEALNDVGIDVWFKVYPSQFQLEFDVLVRSEDLNKAKQLLLGVDTKLPYDPADQLKKSLGV